MMKNEKMGRGIRYLYNTFHRIKYYKRIVEGTEVYFKKQINIPSEILGNYDAEWCIASSYLNNRSLIYSFGVGTDISFDLRIIEKSGCSLYAFDPTPRSLDWIKKQILPEKFTFLEYGISDRDDHIMFYPPANPEHVSFSANATNTNTLGEMLPVYRLKSIMGKLEHNKIDVLKMDIEGLEYKVLKDILNSDIEIKQILIEFHHRFDRSSLKLTTESIKSLQKAGYKIFYVSPTGEEYSFIKV